ncbi:acyltransferase [Mycoavidus sp. B2-EB]|uniref:acyltransferase n=1 Tax=Mycoavidus sp. B2-EB TaxID=2651972 RepID=UPI00162631B5|nr:acyltransferase family protein [Mycoavidus sp. B2-EB]BBO60090.1 hypothetical protein MPB2EB_1228 [Mycoavidus sp. B2-EB]
MDNRIAWLRILACFLVVVVHVSAPQFGSFGKEWWAVNFLDSFSRVCVPLFLMISGTTLLHKVEPVIVFLKKRLLRILPPLIVWSLFYLWWLKRNHVETGNWLTEIVSGPVMYHLWFLYAIIGIYALIPLLRRFYQTSTSSERLWVLIIWFLVSSLGPAISTVLNTQGYPTLSTGHMTVVYHLSHFSGYAGFLLLGASLAQKKIHYSLALTLYGLGSLATMAITYWLSARAGKPAEAFYEYSSPFVIIAACGLFSAVMSRPASNPSPLVSSIADCTLGAYCLHLFIISLVGRWIYLTPIQSANAWIAIPVVSIIVFVISISTIFIARRIPLLRPFL